MERNFLIVAADGRVRQALAEDLRKKGFTVTLAANGQEAERVVQSVSVRLVLVESHLPDMPADELRSRLRRLRPDCRVILLTSFDLVRNSPELLRFGSRDYLVRSDQVFELLGAAEERHVTAGSERTVSSLIQVIDVLVGLIELEHRQFVSSSHQAMQLARDTAEEMSADAETVQEVIIGTLLRDIGRVATEPDNLGSSPGATTVPDDHERVREHVSASLRLLEHVDFPWKVLPVIRHHHERYNGSGSPDGLRGREIPMGARIVAVVDAFVDLTSGRRSDAIEPDKALQELVRRAGHQFDPEVVEAFHRVMDKRLAGRHAKHKPVVLVADSNDHFRRLLKMRLLNEGIGVEEAESPRRTLKVLRKRNPDLLLIDVDTEATDAFPILHEVQQDPRLCNVPVAFLASRHDRVLQLRALRQGVDDFLLKTDDMEVLLARIENILMRSAMRAEGEVRKSRRGITGSLENLSLPDIIQTLTIGMKTACVTVSSQDRQGRIWFENGAPRHAETNRARSEEAFYEMVRWTSGEFVIEHGIRSEDRSLSHDAMFLLMEGLRLMDEEANPDAVHAAN